jgi:uncharacterized protein YkwD
LNGRGNALGRFFIVLFLAAACALAVSAYGAPAKSEAPPKVAQKQLIISSARLEKTIHALINRERAAQGEKPLAWDGALGAIARRHSADMAKRNYFSHDSPGGESFDARYRKGRYRCFVPVGDAIHQGAENIAREHLYTRITTVGGKKHYDWRSEEEIARATAAGWMASRGHRANILTAHWKREGIGVVVTRDYRVYVTQNFC